MVAEGNTDFLTPAQVAAVLQVSRNTVYAWLKSGRLKAVRFGRGWRVRREDLK